MCGIAGKINFNKEPIDKDVLKRMTDSIRHRGPDDSGLWLNESMTVGLGHRRLSIIDLSKDAHQPMSNENSSIWLIFNGEIYNYLEIREELIQKGHRFKSKSDSEVIIHSYEEWGYECLHKFNGMFAFAIWDDNKKKLWLVRDRIGIKPLFYCHSGKSFIFASEIKSILSIHKEKSIDYEALSYYLSLNYTPSPHTLLKNIRQIQPGHYLLLGFDGKIEFCEYWDLKFNEIYCNKESEYIEKFIYLLEDSVKKQMVSDVPLGAFLSGGLDSSSITQILSSFKKDPVKTFSIGFAEDTFSELKYARLVSNQIHTNHYEQIIKADLFDVIHKIVQHSEEPIADSSMIGIYYLSKLAKEHVSVVHVGDGADEILAGYETYQAYYLHKILKIIPDFMHTFLIVPLINFIPISNKKMSLESRLKRFLNTLDLKSEDAHAMWRVIFNKNQKNKLLSPIINEHPDAHADIIDIYRMYFKKTNAKHPLNKLLYVDCRFYLPNDMLVKVDRMTMAHGLEARVPFLDHRLVEMLASVPPMYKMKYFLIKKYLLKKAMRSRLPREILTRQKAGFNFPISQWVNGDLKPFLMDLLSKKNIQDIGILNYNYIQNILQDHIKGKLDNSHQIWCLMILVLWWNTFYKGSLYDR